MHNISLLLRRGRALLLALLAATLTLPALAQDAPPGRIGRIAWTSGDVYLNNPDTGELGAAPLNQPLTSGDIVATGPGTRAEIQIGAMTLRLDANSRIEFDRIDDDAVRVRLDDGSIIAKVPTEDIRRDFVLETQQGRFIPRETGIYRVDDNGDNNGGTTASTYFGSLRFEGRDFALDINAGESARIGRDGAGRPDYRMAQGVRDEFTQWSAARDQRQRASASSRYVSPEMTGAQDLDAYGDWSETPEYGAAWFPRAVAADWAPYRTGHWAWVAPWGWTWVGYEPWGFAPFHYGRWVRVRGAWAWIPGTFIARPVYAPALVGWVGTPGVSVSVSIGSAPPVGWFPLAPREVYVPLYRSTTVYVQRVNAPHVTHVHNLQAIVTRPHEVVRETRFAYRDEPRAMSVAPPDAFRHRRPDARIAPRPGDVRDFRERPVHAVTPVLEPRRAVEPDRRHRPDGRSQADAPLRNPGMTVETSPRREPEFRRGEERGKDRRHERHDEAARQVQPQLRTEPPQRAVQRVEPQPLAPAVREQHHPEIRRDPPPAVQRSEPVTPPPMVRQPPQERPREFQRPPEPRREEHVQPAPRIERPQPERREQRDEPRQRHEDRRERDRRPGDGEHRGSR